MNMLDKRKDAMSSMYLRSANDVKDSAKRFKKSHQNAMDVKI